MARPRALALASIVALAAEPAPVQAAPTAPGALPPLPAAGASRSPGGAPDGAADPNTLRRGIVQVEQAGRPMAVGTVLSKDGRVLTSLSALGATEQPEIRYADDTVVKAKVGHKDKAWDLALLVPQSGRWTDGLMPTDTDPSGLALRTFLPKAGKLAALGVALKGRTDARAKDGDPLRSVLALDLKGTPAVPGAPLLDPNGKVVGVLVRACKGTGGKPSDASDEASGAKRPPCAPVTIGAPVSALRSFLMKTPASAVQPAPWLGLGGTPTEAGDIKGIRVMGVAPGSPAERAGLSAAETEPDTIVAVDGAPVETPEQLAELIAKRAVGQTVKLLVYSHGKFREAAVVLRAAPP